MVIMSICPHSLMQKLHTLACENHFFIPLKKQLYHVLDTALAPHSASSISLHRLIHKDFSLLYEHKIFLKIHLSP